MSGADSIEPVYRAPMRPRTLDGPPGAGADHAVSAGLVGTGDALRPVPADLTAAVHAAERTHGPKAARMLARFAGLPDGTLLWTRTGDGAFRLGRITGPWHYDDRPPARASGLHHVRPARWLPAAFGLLEVPAAVARTFARGGRNLQRIHDPAAERESAGIWTAAV